MLSALLHGLYFFILLEQYGDRAKAISNAMRNVFGIVSIFVWAFATTTNTMVSNLIGQNLQHKVVPAIIKIMRLSFFSTLIMVTLLNVFPQLFLNLFGQDEAFVAEAIPVLRMVSLGMLCMSIGTVWLNAVTGTGRTKVNLGIEIVAIIVYIIYIYYVMVRWRLSLTITWSNELVYWASILILAFWYIKSGKWKTADSNQHQPRVLNEAEALN